MQYILSLRALIIALVTIAGAMVASVTLTDKTPASMHIEPTHAIVTVGEETTFSIKVASKVPVNAFTGELVFDSDLFTVSSIDYNTSIANLWAEEPWYNRADNSIYFAGGTTAPGGFVGSGTLLIVTLKALRSGDTNIALRNERILAHDGLGSDVALVKPLDALLTVDTTPYRVALDTVVPEAITIVPTIPSLDVNNDGAHNFQDIAVILLHFGKTDPAYDFNGDGTVGWGDIRAWQQLRKAN